MVGARRVENLSFNADITHSRIQLLAFKHIPAHFSCVNTAMMSLLPHSALTIHLLSGGDDNSSRGTMMCIINPLWHVPCDSFCAHRSLVKYKKRCLHAYTPFTQSLSTTNQLQFTVPAPGTAINGDCLTRNMFKGNVYSVGSRGPVNTALVGL